MVRILFFLILIFSTSLANAQLTTEPAFPKADEPVTFTIDVTGTALANYNDPVWAWTWIIEGCSSGCDAPTNVTPATAAQDAALMTKSESNPNIYSITFTPTEFFSKPADQILTIGILAKGRDWENGQTGDFSVNMSSGGFEISIIQPSGEPVFLEPTETLEISASASGPADLKIFINEELVATANGSTISYTYTAVESGKFIIKATGDDGTTTSEDASYFIVSASTVVEPRPAGIIAGINYDASETTKATLDLWAPNKGSVFVIGDFNEWEASPEYQMKKDGEHFWLEINGLEAGTEYGFQYIVDETIYIADPYADKILDPDDQFIPTEVYPDLKPYPAEALHTEWYFNRISVLETGQEPYAWQHERVELVVDSLIIYELLIRDFFDEGARSYANLTDTLSYLKELGVNAIELMPVMEFNGNESWGYNPTFKFAVDKYYGSKEDLKAFIDAAHGMDMAVILDIVMNHHDLPNPYIMMYFDYSMFKPTAENPWYNINATHPFSVFMDFNHESSYTQEYLDTVNHYWLNEYKIDGFRYDLSKGFTQKNTGGDVGAWSSYDASRIALLKRMSDEIRTYNEDAVLILEHFADNTEEKELAEYGFLLWGNFNYSYSQLAMGYSSGSDISWSYYENRGWSSPHLVTYMESHDEERVSFRVENYGNSTSSYSTKPLEERMERLKGAALFAYMIPGPKMMWQWGEWGYDISIEEDGRLGIKPLPWNNVDGLNYNNSPERKDLYEFYKTILNLRRDHPVFSFGDATLSNPGTLLKQVVIKNDPYVSNPTSAEEMNVVFVGNFDISSKVVTTTFPHTGMWYSYFNNNDVEVSSSEQGITLQPGEFRLFTDVKLVDHEVVTAIRKDEKSQIHFYPNPVKDNIKFNLPESSIIRIYDQKGQLILEDFIPAGQQSIVASHLLPGLYLLKISSESASHPQSFKLIKQ